MLEKTWLALGLRAFLDLVVGLILTVYQTEPRFIATIMIMSAVNLVVTTLYMDGKIVPGKLRRFGAGLVEIIRIAVILLLVTPFANLLPALAWILDGAYAYLCGRIVRQGLVAVTAPDSDFRAWLSYIFRQVAERNQIILNVQRESTAREERQRNDRAPDQGAPS